MTTTPTTYTVDDYLREYDKVIDDLAAHHQQQAAQVYAAWLAGTLATDAFARALSLTIAGIVGTATGAGAGLAARLLWFTEGIDPNPLRRQSGAAELGIDPEAELERILKAADTLAADLDTATDLTARLDRLVLNEAADKVAQGAQASARQLGATGYTRGLESDACKLCQWLHKGGHVYPLHKPMHRHVGCRCAPIPTTKGETDD